jgi:hypothetical protein
MAMTIVISLKMMTYMSFIPLFMAFHSTPVLRWSTPQYTTARYATKSQKTDNQDEATYRKNELLESIRELRNAQQLDGELSVDFGVKGGELDKDTRTPSKVDYYSISPAVGRAADDVIDVCYQLADVSPTEEPTLYLGDKKKGYMAPLNGPWKLLFTTAADATFSKNSKRGSARVQNIVDAARGTITNVIDFDKKDDGTEPALKQLNVVIGAKASNKDRVELQFRYAKAILTRFFFVPLFGRTLTLYIPVPAAFITRCIVFFSRLFRLGRKGAKKVPKAYFDVIYLDSDLRIHKTGEDNLYIQARESWKEALPLLE